MTITLCRRCCTRKDGNNGASYCPAVKLTKMAHDWFSHDWFSPGVPQKPASDPISPSHYSRFKIQPIEFIMANGLGYCAGNVIKYVCRHDAKNGLEDLKKARSYLDRMIEAASK